MRILRALLVAVAVLAIGSVAAQSPADDSTVSPGYRIELARDGGSHPAFTTEWWYLTGWLQDAAGKQRGFQVTFFRSRNATADENPSAFAPRQILFAHAAVSDPIEKKLLRDEKIARAGFGLAETKQGATNVWIDNWSLRADGENLVTEVTAEDFSFSLQLQATQAVLLQGEQGYSRKDPDTASASYYYSLPQLDVAGSMTVRGSKVAVTGKAWFDHEWSNSYVNAQSAGWDWVGINLNESDALMVFRMRDLQGRQRWAGGTLRTNNKVQTFTAEQIKWTPLQTWRSPRTGVEYPVAWRVNVGEREFILRPLMNDQENDARGSVGILYWEGAVEATDTDSQLLGRGYLELTGYGEAVKL